MDRDMMLPLLPEEEALLQGRLMELLAHQIQLYTHGESSSVQTETAEELLRSICFCLRLSPEAPGQRGRDLLELDIAEELRMGREEVRKRKKEGQKTWREVCDNLPPVLNVYMLDTLKELGKFWKRYDIFFFAHRIPCEIDYPLYEPVPESLLGIDYVMRYLDQLAWENRFLSGMPADKLKNLLDRSGFDYQTLPINLLELAREQASLEKGS